MHHQERKVCAVVHRHVFHVQELTATAMWLAMSLLEMVAAVAVVAYAVVVVVVAAAAAAAVVGGGGGGGGGGGLVALS